VTSWPCSAEPRPIPTIEFSPRARRAVARGRRWWRENRDKAPDAFDEELDRLLAAIEIAPSLVGSATSRAPHIRRVFLKRIRYYVFFEASKDGERVSILAVWHASRGRGPAL
jgi:plasmid stabilization system protein ParE